MRVLPWGRATLWTLLLLAAAASSFVAWRGRAGLAQFARERWRTIAIEEIVFFAFFAFLLWCRWKNPDLWHAARGGEKPMDFTYLNAVVKSTFFPPYDPWFAGGYLNYYYFGFVLSAALVLLTGVVPAVAYNLIVPTFFALTAAGAFAGAAALSRVLGRPASAATGVAAGGRRVRRGLVYGLLGAVLVVAVGNMSEVSLLVRGLRQLGGAPQDPRAHSDESAVAQLLQGLGRIREPEVDWPLPNDWWFWNASRAIPHPETEPPPITEFPFFTFLFADLHAHMMAMPITLLVLALAIQLTLAAQSKRGWGREAATLALLALATGSVWPINTWDYPLAILLTGIGLVLREAGRLGWGTFAIWWRAAWRLAVVAIGGRLAFLWFHQNFGTSYTELGLWTGSHTAVSAYLAIHGLFLLLLLGWVIAELAPIRRVRDCLRMRRAKARYAARPSWERRRRRIGSGASAAIAILVAGSLLAIGLYLADFVLEALIAMALALTFALLVARRRDVVTVLVCLVIGIGLGLSALVEHVVLSGDIGRMNTVFKFYLEIWLLWGTVSAAALAALFAREPVGSARRSAKAKSVPRTIGRFAYAVAIALCLFASLLYTVFATPARLRDRVDEQMGPSLDGSAFLEGGTHHDMGPIEFRSDAEVVRWLEQNVVGNPVVLEASIPPYRWGSRISMFTGLPTVVGWDWHQRQQRSIRRSDPVPRRVRDVELIYSSLDIEPVSMLLQRYGVELIVVGQVERNYYHEAGLAKFAATPELFTPLYSGEHVQIYRFAGASVPGAPPLLRADSAQPGVTVTRATG
jgi:YYY domain-containing protein